jgi:hypothetical protein
MTTPQDFLKTVYLGDRACKGYILESWEKRFALIVDSISRIRSPSGIWEFDTSEDIEDGHLVFEGVTSLTFSPCGPLPNDYILGITSEPMQDTYVFHIAIASVGSNGTESCEVKISVQATDVYLRDPKRPELQIRT